MYPGEGRPRPSASVFEKAAQTSIPGGMAELLESPSFDLPHPLAAEFQLLTDFLKGTDLHVPKTKPWRAE